MVSAVVFRHRLLRTGFGTPISSERIGSFGICLAGHSDSSSYTRSATMLTVPCDSRSRSGASILKAQLDKGLLRHWSLRNH